jgi:hypothetical protein
MSGPDTQECATTLAALEAVRQSTLRMEQEFLAAMGFAAAALHFLKLKKLGSIPVEIKEPDENSWFSRPVHDNASDQLEPVYYTLQSKKGDLEYVRGSVDDAIWLIANGRIESSKQ